MKYLAVLLTVYNRKAITLSCLEKLYTQVIPAGVEMHVYLTNDGCTDGTPEAIRERFPQVHIVEGDGTLFWNRGMWKAWDTATNTKSYDWYLWLNDDTELMPGAVTELINASNLYGEKPCIIVGATKASDSNALTYGGRINNIIQPCDGTMHEIDYFNGNIVLVSKQAYNILGNLDYYYTHSRGDYDYGVRAKKAGITMVQCGKVLGICDKHKTPDKWCDPNVPLLQRCKMLYKPSGMPPNEIFHLEKREYGFLTAAFHFITIHIRCIYPKFWNRTNE